ncbi:uncharacterized protein LOC129962222 [Argiope bruennichi]|uniref:uncharacterized protein LOC129962222 n=1 Tax=Argiope bruennichi TaxID=94029 RepID=UPI00249473A9|nr:uncharacterized protein LOC129962222 [Argiope bruennichi]
MEKNNKNSSNDKEAQKNAKKIKDESILPPKMFSNPSQNNSENSDSKNDKNTNPKSTNQNKSGETDDNEVNKQEERKKADNEYDNSKDRQKAKPAHFEDDILAELKREFPTDKTKSKRRVRLENKKEYKEDTGSEQKADLDDDDGPKPRARSNAIKEGLRAEPEFPDMPSQDIIVEKGGATSGQNLMGEKGFISSLLFDVISKEDVYPLEESKSKPISKQNLLEQKSTVMAVRSDISALFDKKKAKSVTFLAAKKKPSKSKSAVSRRLHQKPIESQVSVTTKSQNLPPDLQHLKSGWQPTEDVEETPQVGFRQRKQSWVGTYVDGTDYWSKRETSTEQEEVPFEIDQRGQTWYDLPVADEVQIEIPTAAKRTLSRAKFDAIKMQSPQELAESADEDKKRLFSFDDREPIPEKISSDLYQMFLEFCKTDDLSAVQNRLSLLNADRSLEKVGLLDHKKLTMVHTGLCFKAAGGSRYRGLSFAQYKLFIEMVAETRKMPVFDFVNRLKLGYAGIIVLPADRG